MSRAAAPGRMCPLSYRYPPRVFDREPEIRCEVLYVVGGLYGNVEALEAVQALAAREASPPTIVFNGDFHWFDVAPADFERIEAGVGGHRALRGNVETEIAGEDRGAGCGCAYPADVDDGDVERSNAILERLRATASGFPRARRRLARLPMHLVAQVGAVRVGIVHGDAASLAGWGFAHDRLDDPAHGRWLDSAFRDARVDVFASTHTCLPAMRRFAFGAVANNGAAGMPNFAGTRFGLVTRIAKARHGGGESIGVLPVGDAYVESLRVDYDDERWRTRFLASWPPGSPAYVSYARRLAEGPRFARSPRPHPARAA